MSDKEFLLWLRDRLITVYHESPNTDFVHKLTAIANATACTFHCDLTENERLTVLCGLATFTPVITSGSYALMNEREFFAFVNRIAGNAPRETPSPNPNANAQNSGTEAARAVLAPPAPTDYFARDRKGNVLVAPPKGSEEKSVRILQANESTEGTPRLSVVFTGGKGNCFDSQLWELIKRRVGQDTTLWIAKSGNYLNIVGVRA
jgi:hypothetical protein